MWAITFVAVSQMWYSVIPISCLWLQQRSGRSCAALEHSACFSTVMSLWALSCWMWCTFYTALNCSSSKSFAFRLTDEYCIRRDYSVTSRHAAGFSIRRLYFGLFWAGTTTRVHHLVHLTFANVQLSLQYAHEGVICPETQMINLRSETWTNLTCIVLQTYAGNRIFTVCRYFVPSFPPTLLPPTLSSLQSVVNARSRLLLKGRACRRGHVHSGSGGFDCQIKVRVPPADLRLCSHRIGLDQTDSGDRNQRWRNSNVFFVCLLLLLFCTNLWQCERAHACALCRPCNKDEG